jgi:chromosome partitioning protein
MSEAPGPSSGPNWLDLDAEVVSRESAATAPDWSVTESAATDGNQATSTTADTGDSADAGLLGIQASGNVLDASTPPPESASMMADTGITHAPVVSGAAGADNDVCDRVASHRADDVPDAGGTTSMSVEVAEGGDTPVPMGVDVSIDGHGHDVNSDVGSQIAPQAPETETEAGAVVTAIEPTEPTEPPVSRETAPDQPTDGLADATGAAAVSRETKSPATVPITADSQLDQPTSAALPSAAGTPAGRDHETPIAREAAQAVKVLNVRQERWPSPARTRVLTVANQKGGVGKTTSAVNIAAALALHGLHVLLIDLDPQGNASTALGIEHGVGTPSIYDVLLGGQPLADVAQVADFAPTLRCVPATLDLAGADIELTSQVAREYRLQKALLTFLDSEHGELDYVIIDCPPSLGLLTLNALVAAREVLLPIQCEYYALEGLAQLLKTVDLVTSHLNPYLVVTTVLLTMYDSRTRLADQVADEVRRHFGPLVLGPTIPRNVRVSEAPGFGQTVITYDPGSRGAIGYVQAAQEIAERGARGEHENIGRTAAEETQ